MYDSLRGLIRIVRVRCCVVQSASDTASVCLQGVGEAETQGGRDKEEVVHRTGEERNVFHLHERSLQSCLHHHHTSLYSFS